MKFSKLFTLFVFLTIFTTTAHADRYLVEGKVGYFRPFSSDLRDIYSDGWANYQLEVSYSYFDSCDPYWWSRFFAWGSYNYIYDKGETRSHIDDDMTDIQLYSFSLGIKYIQPMPCNTRIYGAVGLRYFFLRIDNEDDVVDRKERAAGLGGVCSLGVLFQPYKCFVMDFFTDIALKRFSHSNFSRINAEIAEGLDVSGVTFGIGIGIIF